MAKEIKITIKKETIFLLPERAALWVNQRALIVSDIHLGKVATFQRMGIPIPEGAMEEDLLLLENLVSKYKVSRCIIVGDLIHSRQGVTERVKALIQDWLQNLTCQVDLVFGNHDRYLIKHLPKEWNLQPHHQDLAIPPFLFSHAPKEEKGFFVWSGHIHPQFIVEGMRLPCFYLKPGSGILPAFSSFAGGYPVKKTSRSRVYVIADKEIFRL